MEESLARDVARKLRGPTGLSIPDTAIGVRPPYRAGRAAAARRRRSLQHADDFVL
jgi:hypothetical protein